MGQVPHDLVSALEQLEKTHPRHQVLLDKIAPLEQQRAYRGPTWLDQATDRSSLAPSYGFGAELGRAVRARTELMRTVGINPAAAEVGKALIELERRDLGAHLAEQQGATFVPDAERVRGRLSLCEPTSSGARYAQIFDEREHRLALVPAAGDLDHLLGRQVEVVRGEGGKLLVRGQDLGRQR